MAFDFPNSPTEGQIFSPSGGPQYIFRSPAWEIYSVASNPRNRIVNPAMQISQENGVSSVGSTLYPADQWQMVAVSSSTITAAQVKATAGTDQPNYVALNASPAETAAAASEYIFLQTQIEGVRVSDFCWGSGQARQAIIAFDAYLPVAGTYWVAVMNAAGTHTFLGSYTIAAGEIASWVRKSVVITAGAVSAGVWPVTAASSVIIRLTVHCGTTSLGVAGFQSGGFVAGPGQALGLSTAGQCFFTNVGLYLDASSTGVAPRWETPDEAAELMTCRRYYAKYASNHILGFYGSVAGENQYTGYQFQTAMRIAPALASPGSSVSNATLTLTSPQAGHVDGCRIDISNTAIGACYALMPAIVASARM